jgi:hypothetical protein
MDRWLTAAVMALTVSGCAAGIEDPQPAPPPEEPQKAPPTQPLSGEVEEQEVGNSDQLANVPPRQRPPLPGIKPVD